MSPSVSFKGLLNIFSNASPTPEALSLSTLKAAPRPASVLSNNSAPFLVLAKNVTTEPKAMAKRPIPVAAIPFLITPNNTFAPVLTSPPNIS